MVKPLRSRGLGHKLSIPRRQESMATPQHLMAADRTGPYGVVCWPACRIGEQAPGQALRERRFAAACVAKYRYPFSWQCPVGISWVDPACRRRPCHTAGAATRGNSDIGAIPDGCPTGHKEQQRGEASLTWSGLAGNSRVTPSRHHAWSLRYHVGRRPTLNVDLCGSMDCA